MADDSYIVSDRRYVITGQWLREMFLTAYRAGQRWGVANGGQYNESEENERWEEFAGWKTAAGTITEEAPSAGRKKSEPQQSKQAK